MTKGWEPGIYRVKMGRRWTVAEYVIPADDNDAYWVVLGSQEEFATKEFTKIGQRVHLPE
jgi:hypothetical protein